MTALWRVIPTTAYRVYEDIQGSVETLIKMEDTKVSSFLSGRVVSLLCEEKVMGVYTQSGVSSETEEDSGSQVSAR